MVLLGVGAGVIVLVAVWVVAVLAAVVASSRRRSLVAVGVLVSAAVLSISLLLIPQHSDPHQPPAQELVTDKLFVGRVVVVAGVGLAAVAGVAVLVAESAQPILAAPLKKVKLS